MLYVIDLYDFRMQYFKIILSEHFIYALIYFLV